MAARTLYGILTRDGRSVVVFRRGPSRTVLLLRWWLGSDTARRSGGDPAYMRLRL